MTLNDLQSFSTLNDIHPRAILDGHASGKEIRNIVANLLYTTLEFSLYIGISSKRKYKSFVYICYLL